MSALDKVLQNYRRRKHLETNVKWISRQKAAQILNVSIQRVNQLVKQGRLRTLNTSRRGSLNPVREEDVLGHTRRAKGRSRAKPGQNRVVPTVRTRFGFKIYQNVIYEHPTEFGYNARVPAKIIHFGPKKVLIEALTAKKTKKELWVYPRQLLSKAKKGERTTLFIKFENIDYPRECAITICSPFRWNLYLKKWQKILSEPANFENFNKQFTVLPITKSAAAKFSRFLGGSNFGKFPEYRTD